MVDGGAPLVDLEAELQHGFDREDVSTVGGLVLALFGRVPRTGESITLSGYRFTVEQVVRRRIRRVVVLPADVPPVEVTREPARSAVEPGP